MPFEIISSKQCGADLKVIFDIMDKSSATNKIVVNVHDLAFVTFHKQKENNAFYVFHIQVKKTELAKDLTITLKCSKDHETIDFICLEEWSEWKRLSSTKKIPFIVYVRVTASKVISPLLVILNKDTNFTDFELKADDGTVAVHKTILAAHSDMFKTMLLGCWKETQEGRIELEGLTRATLQHFKDYMYLGTLPEVGLQQLLLLAIRYLVDILKAQILLKISMTVTEDNLHDFLSFAIQHNCHELLHNLLQKTPDKILVAAFNKKKPTSPDNSDTD